MDAAFSSVGRLRLFHSLKTILPLCILVTTLDFVRAIFAPAIPASLLFVPGIFLFMCDVRAVVGDGTGMS
jgi:hypothetical protein